MKKINERKQKQTKVSEAKSNTNETGDKKTSKQKPAKNPNKQQTIPNSSKTPPVSSNSNELPQLQVSQVENLSPGSSVSSNTDKNFDSKSKVSKIKNENQWKPVGFKNFKGYCFLNSIIQVLLSCEDFRKAMEDYDIDNLESDIFVRELFHLVRALKVSNINLEKTALIVEKIQEDNTESPFGDDVYKCFINTLTRINKVINSKKISSNETDDVPLEKLAKNSGFVFDNFYGQLKFQVKCKICQKVLSESYQMIKSLPLPVIKSENSVTLEQCVSMFFSDSDIEMDASMECLCPNGTNLANNTTEITQFPKYLFIYLNRGSYISNGSKNNTYVTCEGSIKLKDVNYKLISVINHIGDISCGHYYSICSYNENEWWLLNDEQVTKLKPNKKIVTEETIAFVFKISTIIERM